MASLLATPGADVVGVSEWLWTKAKALTGGKLKRSP